MIELAKKRAASSTCKSQHGAVISKGKSISGSGCNSYKTHKRWGGGPLKTLHAEGAAVRDAVRRNAKIAGSTIYVARVGSCNQNSRPCKSCLSLIREFGIVKIVYTGINGEIISEWPLQG